MDKTARFSISGKGAETDAPTVDELLDQVRDYFDILHDVEGAIAGDGDVVIDWRIVWAGKNSKPRIIGTNRSFFIFIWSGLELNELPPMPEIESLCEAWKNTESLELLQRRKSCHRIKRALHRHGNIEIQIRLLPQP